jgi:hypothetical protein
LIEHVLELREVARRLKEDPVPLLVVGRDGPEYVVTVADFTRPAGQAGVLAVVAVLDGQLDGKCAGFCVSGLGGLVGDAVSVVDA